MVALLNLIDLCCHLCNGWKIYHRYKFHFCWKGHRFDKAIFAQRCSDFSSFPNLVWNFRFTNWLQWFLDIIAELLTDCNTYHFQRKISFVQHDFDIFISCSSSYWRNLVHSIFSLLTRNMIMHVFPISFLDSYSELTSTDSTSFYFKN